MRMLLAAILAAGLVGGVSAQETASVHISGEIFDMTGTPIPNTAVTLTAPGQPVLSTRTDDKGLFQISAQAGVKYQLLVQEVGFRGWRREVDAESDVSFGRIVLQLASTEYPVEVVEAPRHHLDWVPTEVLSRVPGTVALRVLDRAGRPVDRATLSVESKQTAARSVGTGWFLVQSPPKEAFRVAITAPGFKGRRVPFPPASQRQDVEIFTVVLHPKD